MPLSKIQLICLAGAASAAVATAAFALVDPTVSDADRVAQAGVTAGRLSHRLKAQAVHAENVSWLMQQPIFIMSTGPDAYHEKALAVAGIAITRGRRAALVAIDGQAPRWLQVGETAGDLTLIDVGIDGATFDTPVGKRIVGLSPPAPADAATAATPQTRPSGASNAPSNGLDF